MRRAQRVGRTLFGRLVFADRHADEVVTSAEMFGVPAGVLGVVAEQRLKPPQELAPAAVRGAVDVNVGEPFLTVEDLVVVGREPGAFERPAGIREGRVVDEDADDSSARVGKRVCFSCHARTFAFKASNSACVSVPSSSSALALVSSLAEPPLAPATDWT